MGRLVGRSDVERRSRPRSLPSVRTRVPVVIPEKATPGTRCIDSLHQRPRAASLNPTPLVGGVARAARLPLALDGHTKGLANRLGPAACRPRRRS